MNRILASLLGSVLLLPFASAAQERGAPARKGGTIFKNEVDGLIDVLRATARGGDPGGASFGVLGGDVATTAKVLVAMALCHRRYHVSDGPVVRPSIDALLRARRSDGSFGDVETTAWVADALLLMDEDGFREEAEIARRWLAGKGGFEAATFDAHVITVLDQVRADRFPQHIGADAAARSNAWFQAGRIAADEQPAAADALVTLVACQVANRRLDRKAQDPAVAAWSPAQEKAFAWLWQQQQEGIFSVAMPVPDGNGGQEMRRFPDPALTGFGLMALQSKPKAQRSAEQQEAIEKGLRWLLTQQKEDGTFGDRVPNYTTCVVVGALSRWEDPAVAPALQKSQKAILMFQNTEAGGYSSGDRDYGSIGYGNSQRGDLSNLHFSLEALRTTGLPENHEAFQKALVFLQRTQNLKSVNDFSGKVPDPDRDGVMLDVRSGDDGGASYYPGNSAAGYLVQPDGKAIPRSYGSMTYALLKSYTLAGVKGDDPRVRAAVQWIQDNWTLAMNPGADPALGEKVKYQGLFYYYMVLAQALDAAGIDKLETKQGDKVVPIDWRAELKKHLASMQQADGTWVNGKNDRWMEGLPLLCTCYAMAALEHCR